MVLTATSANPFGVIRVIGSETKPGRPSIGEHGDPVVIKNADFDSGANDVINGYGILAGQAVSANIVAHVENSTLASTSNCGAGCYHAGGLIGWVVDASIDSSSFTGNITLGGTGDWESVGGLVGVGMGTASKYGHLNIYESYSDATITAEAYVGGLIGKVRNHSSDTSGMSLYLSESYYWNTNVDSLATDTADKPGGLLGNIHQTATETLNITLRNSYAMANITDGDMAIGSAVKDGGADIGVNIESDIYYSVKGGSTAAQTFAAATAVINNGNMFEKGSQSALFTDINDPSKFDSERWEANNAEQRLYLGWQIEGYYHTYDD